MKDEIATRSHNNPPDPLDAALAPHGDTIAEAEAWLDGAVVENEGQMKAVDDLTKGIKAALKDVTAAEKSVCAPLFDAHKSEKARWKPTIEDLTSIRDGLVSAVGAFKAKIAEEKRIAENAAWEAANKARLDAEAEARKAGASDIEAQRKAAEMAKAAIDAEKDAKALAKDSVKGMRKVTRYEITDHRAALHWIAKNDKPAMTAFIDEYVRRNHKNGPIDGVKVTESNEAF